MPFANVGGFCLHYLLEEDTSTPVIVLSHSLGALAPPLEGSALLLVDDFNAAQNH